MRLSRLVFVALLACRRTPSTTQVMPTGAASAVPLPDAAPSDPASAAPDAGSDALDLGMFEERRMGFTRDDRYLGYEVSGCDPCPTELHLRGPRVPPIDLRYLWDTTLPDDVREAREAKQRAFVDGRIAELGIEKAVDGRALRGPFPWTDLQFASKPVRDPSTHAVSLLVGATLADDEPVFPLRIDLGAHPTRAPARRKGATDADLEGIDMHDPSLVYINVTRDGRDLGAVAAAAGTMGVESAGVARMPAATFAARIYNDTAMRRLREDPRRAATLFEKAEAANPDALFAYNLACALARLEDPSAEAALGRAIQRRRRRDQGAREERRRLRQVARSTLVHPDDALRARGASALERLARHGRPPRARSSPNSARSR